MHTSLGNWRQIFGSRVKRMRVQKRRPQAEGQRVSHLTQTDVWQRLHEADECFDPSYIRKIEAGKAQVTPQLARSLARVLEATDAEEALLSHVAGGDGVMAFLFKMLGVESHVEACMNHADEALLGRITEEEFVAIVEQSAKAIVMELIRRYGTEG